MIKVSHILNSVFNSITYILSEYSSNEVWLVDCGDIEELPKDLNVKGVLLTHSHFDHIYGLPLLLKKFPDCVIYTNAIGSESLADAKEIMSKYHENPLSIKPQHIHYCTDGEELIIFDGSMAIVYDTPGHHPSCLSYVISGYIFTGDAYIPETKTVTNLPKGNKDIANKSVGKILELAQGKVILPGHQLKQ